jgi:hypothetical protein
MFRSNWVFFVAAVMFAYLAVGDASVLHLVPSGPSTTIDLNSIASHCGIASFSIQAVIWIANLLRWVSRRRTKSA